MTPERTDAMNEKKKLADEIDRLLNSARSFSATNHDTAESLLRKAAAALRAQAQGEPVAWMVERPGDQTFPRLYEDEADARTMVAYVNVNPAATVRPLYAAPPAPSDAATGFCEWLKGYLKPDGHLSAFDVETIRGELAAVQQR